MNTLKTNSSKKRNKRVAKQSPEAAFAHEWERVQKFKRQNDRFRSELDTLFEQVKSQTQSQEEKRLKQLASFTHHLAQFVSRKTIPEYLREELVEWIFQHSLDLVHQPFVDMHQEAQAIDKVMYEQFDQLHQYEQEKFDKKLLKQGFSPEEIAEVKAHAKQRFEEEQAEEADFEQSFNEDMFEELFGHFSEDDMFESGYEGARFAEQDEIDKRKDQEIHKLLKATPINVLFRRIARAVHPDLETDDGKKTEKHQLMSQLIEAREHKDVTTILQMYSDYVGPIPKDLFEGNFEKMTALLKHHLAKLKVEKETILHENPHKAFVYHEFYAKTPQGVQKNIRQFLQDCKEQMAYIKKLQNDITSVQRLRPYLEDRYEENRFALSGLPF